MASAMNQIPVIPSPSFTFTSEQQTIINQSSGQTTLPDSTGAVVTTNEQDGPPTAVPTSGVNPEALPAGTDPYTNFLNNLVQVNNEAAGGAWQGSLSNQNIQKMLQVTGAPNSVISPNSAWCATFVAYMLKISGLPYQQTKPNGPICTDAGSYRSYGQQIDLHQPTTWRKGDIIVPTRPGSGPAQPPLHVAFVWGYNASTNAVTLFGGNQGGKVQAEHWYKGTLNGSGSPPYHIVAVRRNWTIPSNLDNQSNLDMR